jgi:AcrR family transcriptional regulator
VSDDGSGARRRSTRARLDPATRRAQLIEVALAHLDDARPTGFSVDEVADAAGVSRSLVYAYFGDRNGLAAEVYLRLLDQLDAESGIDLPADDAALRRVVGGCMAFASRNRAAWRMIVTDPARQHPVVQAARGERAARIAARWALADGQVRDPSGAQLAAEASLGLLESGVLHWIDHPEVPAEQAASLLATILWSGLTGGRRREGGPGGPGVGP